jgi:hypothetical protein
MPPKTDSAARKPRSFEKWKYELRNLKFLGEFMAATGLNTTSAGEKIGISQVSIYYWLKKDDARLSAVIRLIEACGYNIFFDIVDPEVLSPENGIFIETKPRFPEKKLSFLYEALDSVDKEELARKIQAGYSTLYYWFQHDDLLVSCIFKIADAIGKKVRITIRPKNA